MKRKDIVGKFVSFNHPYKSGLGIILPNEQIFWFYLFSQGTLEINILGLGWHSDNIKRYIDFI